MRTPLEAMPVGSITWELLMSRTKVELIRFAHDFAGGSWSHLRSMSKDDLVIRICEYEARMVIHRQREAEMIAQFGEPVLED